MSSGMTKKITAVKAANTVRYDRQIHTMRRHRFQILKFFRFRGAKMCSSYIFKMTFSTKAMQMPRKKGKNTDVNVLKTAKSCWLLKRPKITAIAMRRTKTTPRKILRVKRGLVKSSVSFKKTTCFLGVVIVSAYYAIQFPAICQRRISCPKAI